jgi:succinate dehydrogenase/fumarate reductase flavoprotein subunit
MTEVKTEIKKPTPTRSTPVKEVSHWDIETDVVIVGFGGAGSCAAIEAANAGAEVHLFEVSSAAGGSTALSGGEVYLGGSGGTAMQKKFGFEDTTENLVNYLMMQHAPQADEEKIRRFAEGAAGHFDWLVEMGVPFKESYYEERVVEPTTDDCLFWCGNEKTWPEIEKCKPVPRGHVVQMEGMGAGALLMQVLEKAAVARGVNVHFDSRALSLIVDEHEQVVGLMVRKDGKVLACKARGGVVLCAGGFVMNEKMVKQYAPRLSAANNPIGNPGDTGTGIQMGMSVGGAAINMHEGFSSVPYYPPASLTYSIIVNGKGQRFVNEDAYHGRIGTRLLEQYREQNNERIYMIADVDAYGNYEEGSWLNADVVATGETIEELEQELGLPVDSLSHAMNFYNQHAEAGEDPLFHKQSQWLRPLQAPYVALDMTPGRGVYIPYFTLGGLDTLPSGEVKKLDGSIVPGLYAAGRTACGIPRRGDGYNSGISIADATFSGRQAGVAASQRALSVAGEC